MTRNCLRRLVTLGSLAVALGVAASQADASTFTTLYQFTGGTDGSRPQSGVVQDAAGVLYGETLQAGTTECVTQFTNPIFGCGTLYSFSRTAGLKTLILFNGPNGAVGQNSPLLVGSTLYGTAAAGGASDMGVVFSVHTDGTGFKLLHSFSGADGNQPYGPLVAGPGGTLYGVTFYGGSGYPAQGYGVLYKLTQDGTFTVLHSFTNGADGANPGSLVIERNGVVVGGALFGGYKKGSCLFVGCGTLYEYAPTTSTFTILHTFEYLDGSEPVVGSVTNNGTLLGNSGSSFTFSATKGYQLLPATGDLEAIGYRSVAPTLTPGPSLTSVTPSGAYGSDGSLYRQVGDVLTALHYFSGTDGTGASAPPIISPLNTLIGTAAIGGTLCDCGTIYEYTP